MKKLAVVAALAWTALVTAPTQAATTTGTFDVNITLTTNCLYAKTADVTFVYTSFQSAATATPGGFTVRCTNMLGYAVSLDALTTTDTATNLTYTLALPADAGSKTGNGLTQAFVVSGTMAGDQAGTCTTAGVGAAAGTCTNTSTTGNKQRTVTITY